ncbi:GRIP and coiled-coil domain-containing protein 1 [Oenanthe melanoleuca]|uniref:GRIP and coiled-coil domain-containing protein 1 n=1 Tax=Oenanthe melanoleuca TaxID=2939378 RepID=UPI0024C1B255|nr:GRIP and coiled-coil domain-containing protein 1 [Oenanthe melanoleuca]
MEKFGMSFGGGPSRKELLETIETQKQQLLRFQARLKDVVCAYKSLLKEKEALEASLKVLSVPHEGRPAAPPPAAGDSAGEPGGDSAGTAGPGGGDEQGGAQGAEEEEESGEEPERRLPQLRAQLATLTGALATVTREKSRMEASYQAERRQMKQELEEAAERREAELRRLRELLAESRARLAAQQREREREQGDHGLMLRELQELLRAEREARQAERAQGCERHGPQLGQELQQLRRELQAVRDDGAKADPRVQELQEEMAGLKNHFQLQLVQEMKKTAQAEEQLRQRSQREEQRVAELEAQVAQVSELLGTYEKAKQRDQATIQRLKDRVAQLDLENKTLAVAASSRPLDEAAVDEATLDVAALKEKMEKLRKLLQAAGKGSEEPREPEPPPGTADGHGDKAPGGHCQQELRQLKEEFERYKARAQQVLKSKASKDVGLARELEEAREQLAELRDKHVQLQLATDDMEKQQRRELEAKQQELQQLQQLHRQELERCQLQFRERALRLEEEMHKQRDRALAVLAEKDRELQRLRAPAPPPGPQSDAPGQEDSSQILPQELQPCPGSEPTFFLYAEQLARKEVEIAALRKQRHRLELQLHQQQGRALAQEDKHREELAALRAELQKSCRDRSREGANLEYLKNVVFRFLTLPDARGRQQTLSAILAVLHFSPEERLSVAQSSAHGSWWLGRR